MRKFKKPKKIKYLMGIGDWGLGPIPNPQSPIPNLLIIIEFNKIKII